MKPKRVLQWGVLGGIGGVEKFVYDIYCHIDKEKIQFDFLTTVDGNVAFADKITELGGGIYKAVIPRNKSFIGSYKSFDRFFSSHSEYTAIHFHANFPNYILPLKYAKKYGIEKRVFHAHNSGNMYPASSAIKKQLNELRIDYTIAGIGKYATSCFACSDLAAEYMFRGKYRYSIVNDAIETERYVYNERIRTKVRTELGIGQKFAVGFVGRLQYQKNPEKMIAIYNEIHKVRPDSCLIFVGVGKLYDKLVAQLKEYRLQNNVVFLGQRDDVNELMQAFDCYVMPSRFEGLGISYIEAQAAGLPTFGSLESVPKEVKITDLMHFVSQDAAASQWANQILMFSDLKRRNTQSEIIRAGYDIKDVAKKLERFYLNE